MLLLFVCAFVYARLFCCDWLLSVSLRFFACFPCLFSHARLVEWLMHLPRCLFCIVLSCYRCCQLLAFCLFARYSLCFFVLFVCGVLFLVLVDVVRVVLFLVYVVLFLVCVVVRFGLLCLVCVCVVMFLVFVPVFLVFVFIRFGLL